MIAIRVDANEILGLGHLMRARAIAQSLVNIGLEVLMIGPNLKYIQQKDEKIFTDWIALPWQNSQLDAKNTLELSRDKKCRVVLLDDPRVDENYQKYLLSNAMNFAQFSNKSRDPIWSNLWIDPSSFNDSLYSNNRVKNKSSKLLLGLKYSPFQDSFITANTRKIKNGFNRVLITFGGGDDRGLIEKIVKSNIFEYFKNKNFLILGGISNPRNTKNRELIEKIKIRNVTYLDFAEEPSEKFIECDAAIVAGGTTLHQILYLQIPNFVITVADNQIEQAQYFHNLGVTTYYKHYSEVILNSVGKDITNFLQKKDFQTLNFFKIEKLLDGKGGIRIAKEIAKLL